ncbi:ABC transporter permease [Oscillatoria sp. FACHB-1407]|uniref:ABC transporter permease n=1 Tax=Oscillatoria sp. FACHB-1407 TaxID=2692847 RepID=UPI0016874CD8|nr:ABC transporter permease [Oscillatoria sp. FACHB-1407]MBD2461648.1 ABC transporter permease [Oscillatoria sp. FACHB-1407]
MKGISITPWGVYSVWHRHAKVYQRTWLVNCLPPVSEPIVYLVAFGYGLTPLVGEVNYQGETVSYLQFIAPAMIGIGVLFQSFFEGAYSTFIRLNFQKTWHALLTAPLSFAEVFLGDWLWAATKGMIAGGLTALIAVVWGIYPAWNLLLSLPLMILGSLLFGAMGLLTAGWVRQVDQINVPIFLLIVPMFTLCGTYFPRENLPIALQRVAGILPLSSLVDLLRWHIGLPSWWWLNLLWLIVLLGVFVNLAVRKIYPQLIR